MKKLVLISTSIFITLSSLTSQNSPDGPCNCLVGLDKRKIFSHDKVLEWFSNYFKSNTDKRTVLKKDRNYGGELDVLIGEIPIGVGGEVDKHDMMEDFLRIEKEVKQEGYFSEDNLKTLYTDILSDNQLSAYENCLKTCVELEKLKSTGIIVSTTSSDEQYFTVNIGFKSFPPNQSIKMTKSPNFVNCYPIGENDFYKGMELNDDGQKVQIFRRGDTEKNAIIILEFENGIEIKPNNPIVVEPVQIDANKYPTIRVNNTTWTYKNIDIELDGKMSTFYEGLTPEEKKIYGALYTWEGAKTACKKLGPNWRLPNKSDWEELLKFYGGYIDYSGKTVNLIGDHDKGFKNFVSRNGFDAKYGGHKEDSLFSQKGKWGYYWSISTSNRDDLGKAAIIFYMDNKDINEGKDQKNNYNSCRCVKDN